jgi:hypothetical protein
MERADFLNREKRRPENEEKMIERTSPFLLLSSSPG